MRLDKKEEAILLLEECVTLQTEVLGEYPQDKMIQKVVGALRACHWIHKNVPAYIELLKHAIINKDWSFAPPSIGNRPYPRDPSP
jgi:hypothetical protein